MNERNKRIEDRSGCWDQRIGMRRDQDWEQKIDWEGREEEKNGKEDG